MTLACNDTNTSPSGARRRRSASVAVLPIMLATTLFAPPAVAASTLVSLYYNSAPRSPQQIGSDTFREALSKLPSNAIALDERGGSTLGSEKAILEATRAGAVDMAVVSGSVVSAVVPEMGVYDVPFLFRNANHAEAVARGQVGAGLSAKFADKGLVLLATGKQGFRDMTNSKRPIRSPDDVRGLRLRVIPNDIYIMTFKALGAEPVPMDFPLVYGALHDGRIDGQENPVSTIAGSHLGDVQKYYTSTHHFFAVIFFVANKAYFDKLSPEDRSNVLAAAQAGADKTWRTGGDEDAQNLGRLRTAGMEITDSIDRQPFIDAMKPLEPEFEKRFGKSLLAAIRATP